MTPVGSSADTNRINEFKPFMVLKNFSMRTIKSYT